MGRPPVSEREAADDRERMLRVREGDLARLGELYDRHSKRLYNYFLRLVRDRAAAEDLVQEVFVRMLKYRHTFRDDAELAPWMWTLARHAATDAWRGRPREVAADEATPEPAAAEPHPLARLEREQEIERLSAALGRIPPEKRELLLLARFSELPYAEIGELLGVTVGAVKVRVHRALQDLRSAYQVECAGGAS